MSKMYLGSIDLNKINKDDIVTTDKNGQPFNNGAKYLNVVVWVNDEPDKFGNNISVKAGPKDSSYYIGNAKEWQSNPGAQTMRPQTPAEMAADDVDDLPW